MGNTPEVNLGGAGPRRLDSTFEVKPIILSETQLNGDSLAKLSVTEEYSDYSTVETYTFTRIEILATIALLWWAFMLFFAISGVILAYVVMLLCEVL